MRGGKRIPQDQLDLTYDYTYDQLATLVSESKLTPGARYKITDFATKHLMPNTSIVYEHTVEPLTITAISVNEFSEKAISSLVPLHEIKYDFTDNTCEDGTTPRKGLILERYDPIDNVKTGYDFLGVRYRRWKITDKVYNSGTKVNDTNVTVTIAANVPTLSNLTRYEVRFVTMTHPAGQITVTLQYNNGTHVKPLYYYLNNDPVMPANHLSEASGAIIYNPLLDAFVFMSFLDLGKNCIDTYSSPVSSNYSSAGHGITFIVDSQDFEDVPTFNHATSIGVEIGTNYDYKGTSNYYPNIVFRGQVKDTKIGSYSANTTFSVLSGHGVDGLRVNRFVRNLIVEASWNTVIVDSYVRETLAVHNGNSWSVNYYRINLLENCTVALVFRSNIQDIHTATVVFQSGTNYNQTSVLSESNVFVSGQNLGGSIPNNFYITAPVYRSLIGHFDSRTFNINKTLNNQTIYDRTGLNNILGNTRVDNLNIQNLIAGPTEPINILGKDLNGNVVDPGISVEGNIVTFPSTIKHTDALENDESTTLGQVLNIVAGQIAGLTTDDIPEGSNLYYTDARVQAFGDTRYVRYDTNIQGLDNAQRQNARTNILSVSLDTDETITGLKTFSQHIFTNTSTWLGRRGTNNLVFGNSTLNDTVTGQWNIVLGDFAAPNVTSGQRNIGVGLAVFDGLTGGTRNTSVGDGSGTNITTGSRNTIYGAQAMGGFDPNTGNDNIAIGYQSNIGRETGEYNIAIGSNALEDSTTGDYNIGIGKWTLFQSTGNHNIALGFNALERLTSGIDNIAIGQEAGRHELDLSGINNNQSIYIGGFTKGINTITPISNEIVIGYNAVGEGENTIRLGNTLITKTVTEGVIQHADAVNTNESATLGQLNNLLSTDIIDALGSANQPDINNPFLTTLDINNGQPLYRLEYGGNVQWSGSGFTFNISATGGYLGGPLIEYSSNQETLNAADPTNPRIDVIFFGETGFGVEEGTPSATPSEPTLDPLTQIRLTAIQVGAGATTPTGIVDEDIYLENVEWTGSTSGSITVDFASTTDPFEGTVSIDASSIQNGGHIILTNDSDIDISTYTTIGLQIKLKDALSNGHNIGIRFYNSLGNPVSTLQYLQIDKNITANYQFASLPIDVNNFSTTNIRSVRIEFIRSSGPTTINGYFIDNVILQGGLTTPESGIETFVGLIDTPSDYIGHGSKLVSVKSDETGVEFVDSYPKAKLAETNTVPFDNDYIIGNAGARSGNILFDFTGAKLGASTRMRHNDAGAFTFPTEAELMFPSGDISTSADNFYMFTLVDNTLGSEVVEVLHAMVGGVS